MRFLRLLVVLLAVITAGPVLAAQDLFVSSGGTSSVERYDGATGAYLGQFVSAGSGGLLEPRGVVFGPDQNLYVASYRTNSILRFNGSTGAFMDVFVPSGSGGLNGPSGIVFGPDGNLYVTSTTIQKVLKYNGQSGAFISVFSSSGMSSPIDLIFGPDLNLYVANQALNDVIKLNGTTGAYLETFVGNGSGGLVNPISLAFGHDGSLYVSSPNLGNVLRYDGKSGAFLGIFASGNGLLFPAGITFGPDSNLYIVNYGTNSVLRFDGSTGAFINEFVTAGSGGLLRPRYLTFAPGALNHQPIASLAAGQTVLEGQEVVLDGSLSSDPDGDPLTFQWTQYMGPPVTLDLADPAHPRFTAPEVGAEGNHFKFSLTVNDGKVNSEPASVWIDVQNINKAPVANAGGDQSVTEGVRVGLSAKGSFDPDRDPLSFTWTQIAGPAVLLDTKDPIYPVFVAPETAAGGTILRFELRVTDPFGASSTSTVQVAVNNINQPPVASATPNFTAYEGKMETLDGKGSSDPDGDPLTYHWVQTAGPVATLDLTNPMQPKFIAPQVTRDGATLTFQLTVSDGTLSSAPATTNILVANINSAPVADAGPAKTVLEGNGVALDGSASTDPDGDMLGFAWIQVSGPAVTLNLADTSHPTWTAPNVSATGATLVFELTVNDGLAKSLPQTVSYFVGNVNHVPVASAGTDQAVDEETIVALNGLGSLDADGEALTYSWTQIAGPAVSLDSSDSAQPSFRAPAVTSGATLTFQLTVNDGIADSTPSLVSIAVKDTNHAPVASAGSDKSVGENSSVTLDGSASYDNDGDKISYLWEQTEGVSVTLINPTAMQPSFTAPETSTTETIKFRLTVSDGSLTSTSFVTVSVQNENHVPVAQAGTGFTVQEGAQAVLDGSRSSDADGERLTYLWQQTSGPEVALDQLDPVHPKFSAPAVSAPTELAFSLTVSDGLATSAPATVAILVTPLRSAPNCELGTATVRSIWPPNHKLIRTEITGTSDPANSPVTIAITGVTQDEPTQGLGDGDTALDAVVSGSAAMIRAERSGSGNGRVYSISFTATNGYGISCSGKASVCVPKEASTKSCIDDGQTFDSLK